MYSGSLATLTCWLRMVWAMILKLTPDFEINPPTLRSLRINVLVLPEYIDLKLGL